MLELILIRHGETMWNSEKMFRGRTDVPLSDIGVRQAERLGEYLAEEDISIIYSSPLSRALDTASPLAERRGINVTPITNITDMDFGEWQGLTVREVEERYAELYQAWLDTPEQVGIPGGESLDMVGNRALPFLEDAVVRCAEGKMALVSHRVVLKVLICHLLQLTNASFWNFKLDTGGITRFYIEGGRAVLAGHNDTVYLKGLGASATDF